MLKFGLGIFVFFIGSLSCQAQKFKFGLGFGGWIYSQKLYLIDNSYAKTNIVFHKLEAESLNTTVSCMIDNFYSSVTYFEYKMRLSAEGNTSHSAPSVSLPSNSYATFNLDCKVFYKAFLVSVGVLFMKNSKLSFIPTVGLGAQKRFSEKFYTNEAEAYGYSYNGKPVKNAADLFQLPTRHTLIQALQLRLRYNCHKNFVIDFDFGKKHNNESKFEIGEYKVGNEWFAGLTLSYTFNIKKKENSVPL